MQSLENIFSVTAFKDKIHLRHLRFSTALIRKKVPVLSKSISSFLLKLAFKIENSSHFSKLLLKKKEIKTKFTYSLKMMKRITFFIYFF